MSCFSFSGRYLIFTYTYEVIKSLFANLRCWDYKGVLELCRGAVETGHRILFWNTYFVIG